MTTATAAVEDQARAALAAQLDRSGIAQAMSRADRVKATIEALYAGTATNSDVYQALGWRIVPHGRWSGGIAAVGRYGCQGVSPVTSDAASALFLIHHNHPEEAVRAAMALPGPLVGGAWNSCPIARRICIIALTRPDLRSDSATPETSA